MKTSTGRRMTSTHKMLKAMWVVKDTLIESPADPELEPPIDPMVKPTLVRIRTKAYPLVIKACP